jgi:hypothetical protein
MHNIRVRPFPQNEGTMPVWRNWSTHYRLHWLSWIMLAFASVAMTLIIVPGMPDQRLARVLTPGYDVHGRWTDGSTARLTRVDAFNHGWPFEYLSQPFVKQGYRLVFDSHPVQWSSPNAWPSLKDAYDFSLASLLGDVAIGVAIVVVSVAACELWRRRRGGLRVSLLDFVFIVSCISVALGWYASHDRARTREQAIVKRLQAPGVAGGVSAYGRTSTAWNYHGPDWLMRLVGNPYFLDFCIHVDSITLDSRPLSDRDYADLRTLTYLESIGCSRTLTPELVEALSALPRLRTLDGGPYSYTGNPPPLATATEVTLLQYLPGLTTLKLGFSQLVPSDLDVLARLPALETLQFAGNDLVVDDLERLDTSPTLTTVMLEITATDEEIRAFQKNHPRYRLIWNEDRDVDTWDVVRCYIARWGGDFTWTYSGSLDLSGVELKADRLKYLLPILPEVVEVKLGVVDAPQTALELIGRCRPLHSLDARRVPFTKLDLDKIDFASDEQLELLLQQGPISAEQFQKLLRESKLDYLTIFGSTFTIPEAESIQSSRSDSYVEIYRGLVEDDSESIY